MLPRITRSQVDTALDSLELIIIVQIEIKQTILSEILPVTVCSPSWEVGITNRLIGAYGIACVTFSFRNIQTNIQVSTQSWEEVHLIIKLCITYETLCLAFVFIIINL